MSPTSAPITITTIGIDLGKNTFHLVDPDRRGAIVSQLKLSRAQIERRLANVPPCLIGMEACSGSHHIQLPSGPGLGIDIDSERLGKRIRPVQMEARRRAGESSRG
jgi:hypothetical protein